mmetsp:Transcript_6103/g.8525  ORF Transcript_6103/g.8525 Transcript_6103/m.8525 type:complete len:138 (-) Transcript_6103:127-540(-)
MVCVIICSSVEHLGMKNCSLQYLGMRLSRVDKDPEEFSFLLLNCDAMGVKCEDILGHRIQPTHDDDATMKSQRRKDFSLLSYTFNLDPAMRLEIGDDMAGLVTEYEMFDKNEAVAHQKGMVVNNQEEDFANQLGLDA